MKLEGISIILLSYNERENLAIVVKNAIIEGNVIAKKHEIIIVQYAGSTDGSINEAERLAKTHKNVKVVLQPKEDRGYGMALRLGVEQSTMQWIFYTDSDGQFDFSELRKIVDLTKRFAFITGHRKMRKDPFGRLLAATVYNLMMRIAFGIHVKDIDCAFKLIRSDMLKSFPMKSRTGMYVTEMLTWTRERGVQVADVPVTHLPRLSGEATFQNKLALPKWSVVRDLLREMMDLRARVRADRKTRNSK